MKNKEHALKREKLARTWALMADAVLRALEADVPSAATMEVARKWLEANGCTLDALRNWRDGLGFDPTTLPTFPDDAEGGNAPDALKTIAPFVPGENSTAD